MIVVISNEKSWARCVKRIMSAIHAPLADSETQELFIQFPDGVRRKITIEEWEQDDHRRRT